MTGNVGNSNPRGATPAQVLTRAEILLGSTDRELRALVRSGDLERLHRETYLRGGRDLRREDRYRLRAEAYVRRRRQDGFDPVLAGPSAAVVLDLPLFGPPPDGIYVVGTGSGGRASRGLAIPVARPPAAGVGTVDGFRLVAPARTVLDVARLRSLTAGVVAADAALRFGRCTADDLGAALDHLRGHKGVAAARTCADLADARSESPGESWSAVVLHVNGLPRPERQETFHDDRGPIGRSDFWWPDRRTVGEFDGKVKYGRANPSGRPPEDVLWEEKVREDRLRAIGLTVVRWTTADLLNPETLCGRLRSLLR